ncbi:hypothetical protein TSOC_012545 [Tetrabaena socialis]|uniref:VWFA domain-containing protein n=1 Tax=Tetrabaena socialis TaxID=47790 RepID=A0A2J7ZMS0_9CHLO|nr:hypothetical protein TSOC_012545 [Tetrabaena socialis]|eukprot:PNH01564.1 hypothetical protein TSOC_012545 [Tetrabaena socialis]
MSNVIQMSNVNPMTNVIAGAGDQVYKKLVYAIQNNNLQRFYPYERVVKLTQQISSVSLLELSNAFRITAEVAIDLYQLALYDIVILADDSGSMTTDSRIDELSAVVEKIAGVASRFDQDGMTLCFLNDAKVSSNLRAADVSSALQKVRFSGRTPIGSVLRQRILHPMVIKKMSHGHLQKPVLVITLTDGEPDSKDDLVKTLQEAKDFNLSTGSTCAAFEFAQIGTDPTAQRFLNELDVHPSIGNIVDVTSSFELEEEEYAKAGATLTPHMWILKLMLGAIDPQYDSADEMAMGDLAEPAVLNNPTMVRLVLSVYAYMMSNINTVVADMVRMRRQHPEPNERFEVVFSQLIAHRRPPNRGALFPKFKYLTFKILLDLLR